MKKNLKNYVLPIILAFGMLFSSCEKDLDENVIQQDSKAIIQRISLNEIETLNLNDKLIATVNKIKNKKSENVKGKLVYNPQFDFYIDDEKGMYAEKDGVKSYTFQIFRENPTDRIENIVFNQKDDLFDVYVNKYDLPQADIDKIKREEPVNIDQSQVESTLITSNRVTDCTWHVINIYSNGDGTCTIEWECTGSSGSGSNSSGDSGSLGTNSTTGSNSSSSTTNSGGTTTGNYDPIGNSSSPIYTTNTNIGSTTSSGGNNSSGNSNSPYSPPPPVVTTPIASPVSREEALLRNTFKNQLTQQQSTFFNSLTNAERSNFFNFLYINSVPPEEVENVDFVITEYNSDAVAFAIGAIIRMNANSNLKIDLQKSIKSPTYIDTSSIDANTPVGAKFNNVYNALMTSPKFKEMFIDMFQNNSLYEVKLQIGAIASGANGNTDTNLNNPTCNVITINPNYLNSANKMEIAKTIIHEFIHAYLNVKLCDANQGIPIPTLNNSNLFNVINQQYNGFAPGENQHNFIYNYMLPVMQTILSQVEDLLVNPANNLEMLNDISVHIPLNNSPSAPFIWNDYFHNLSLSGLNNCQFFQNEIGTTSVVNGNIEANLTINQFLMQSFLQYNNLGHQNIKP